MWIERLFFVYILASTKGGVLYVGVTSDLPGRIWQHRIGTAGSFTSKYHVRRLVYFEPHASAIDAITREKQIKHWRRAWKITLIEQDNPDWLDLYDQIAN